MKNQIGTAVLVSCITLLWWPGVAQAEIVIAESMECVLSNSDRVVVGKATKVEKVLGPDTQEYQVVTVTVSETFKGKHSEQVTFVLPNYIYAGYAPQWVEEGIPIVFCLVRNNSKRVPFPKDKFEWVMREDGNGPNTVLLGKSKHYWTGCKPCLTREFTVLTEKDEIVKFVEKTVKAAPKDREPQYHTVDVPGDTAVYKLLYSRSAVLLTVPVDEKLEMLGRQWCKSVSAFQRKEGATILSYFKNDANVSLLKSLLDDPSAGDSTKYQTVPGKTELQLVYRKKTYYVRQAAFTSLGKLGLDVPRPVLEELLEGKDEPEGK